MTTVERPADPSPEVFSAVTASTVPSAGTIGTLPYKREWHSSKVRPRHCERDATVYVRQSSPHQVIEHGESPILRVPGSENRSWTSDVWPW